MDKTTKYFLVGLVKAPLIIGLFAGGVELTNQYRDRLSEQAGITYKTYSLPNLAIHVGYVNNEMVISYASKKPFRKSTCFYTEPYQKFCDATSLDLWGENIASMSEQMRKDLNHLRYPRTDLTDISDRITDQLKNQ